MVFDTIKMVKCNLKKNNIVRLSHDALSSLFRVVSYMAPNELNPPPLPPAPPPLSV